MKTIAIGSDKSGFITKARVIADLSDTFYFVDKGTFVDEVCDYPLFANKVCEAITSKKADFGVLICGSGEGMCIAANKIKGIRCGIAYNDDVTALLRNHNDANVVSFGARFMEYDDIKRRIIIFCNADFLGKHHTQRINQIKNMENR